MVGTPTEDRESGCSRSKGQKNPVSVSSGSDSDSGSSIFITQHPVRRRRRRRSGLTSAGGSTGNTSKKRRERRVQLPTFGFDHFQDGKRTRVELKTHQNIHYHNALIGGFFSSVRELQACRTGDLLSSLPTVDNEGDFIAPISEEETTLEEDVIVKKRELVVFSKTKRPQPWYTPPGVIGQSGDAANTSQERRGGASRSSSSNGKPSGNRWTDNDLCFTSEAEASEVKQKRLYQQEETPDVQDSNSDVTVCERPEEDAQNDGGASPAGGQRQAEEQEEAPSDGFQSQKTKCADVKVPSDHTVPVGESCPEMTEGSEVKDESIKKKKKKKKKKQHQSESEENHLDGTFLHDANLPEKQELMVRELRLDGCTGNTADGVRESQQVTKKNKKRNKEKKRKRRLSPNPCSDTEPQCDDSVSARKTEGKEQTASLDAADVGTSVSESAEIRKGDKVRKKKKKRKLEAAIGDGKASETLEVDEAKRTKREESPVTLARAFGSDADEDCQQIVQDGVVKKKKKKKRKRETEGVPPAGGQHVQSAHEKRSLTPDGHDAPPATHTNNRKKKKRRKRDSEEEFVET